MKILTIDIGGSYIKFARMDESMTVLSRGKLPTPRDGREQLIDALAALYDDEPDVDGIAISLPGIIDSENGYCYMGGALRYNDDFYLQHALHQRCPIRIYMENDAKCASMAEATVGSLKDVDDGFVLLFGTMIGGAYIKDHKLHRGKHFSAGEVSYLDTVRDAIPSFDTVWGNRCGTPHLCKMYAQEKGLDPVTVDGVVVFDAVNSGDEIALDCLNRHAREIAVQIFNIQTLLDPERFAIGGGISVEPTFIEAIKENLSQIYAECPYRVPHAEVVSCKFRHDANLIGAMQSFLSVWSEECGVAARRFKCPLSVWSMELLRDT